MTDRSGNAQGNDGNPDMTNSATRKRDGFIYATHSDPVRYKGFSVPYQLTAWWPDKGKDAVIEDDELTERDKTYRALRDYVTTIASGASVRKFREQLNLTQKAAGELLGGGENSFQKYESGEVEVSQAMLNLLRLIANDSSRLEELKISTEDLPLEIPHKKTSRNQRYTLSKKKGLGQSDLIQITAEGLRTHIMLVPLKRKKNNRDWQPMTQRMGIRRHGKMVYRKGPLDGLPIDEIIANAFKEYKLDPRQAQWQDILNAVAV